MNNISGLLYLSSDDKQTYEDVRSIKYNLPNVDPFTTVSMTSWDFIYGINNINVNNNLAVFETATQSYPVTLVNGNYDYTTFMAQILTQLNTLGLGTFTMTYVNNLYTLNSPVPIVFIINPITGSKDWADMANFPKDNLLRSVTISGVPDLAYTNCVYICCDELNRRQNIKDATSNQRLNNIMGVVYINNNSYMDPATVLNQVVYPKHITERPFSTKWINLELGYRVNSMTIQLFDESGMMLPLESANCGSVKYTLEIMTKNSY